MSKLYTTIGFIMLLTSCAYSGEQSNEQKLKTVEIKMQDKLSTKNAAELLDIAKAKYGDSINYVSDIFIGVEKDTVIQQNK